MCNHKVSAGFATGRGVRGELTDNGSISDAWAEDGEPLVVMMMAFSS